MEDNSFNEDFENALKKPNVDRRLITEAILNDAQLKFLNRKRAEIISLVVPMHVIDENGKVDTIWLDENNHPQLKSIDELIEFRTNQIINHYL